MNAVQAAYLACFGDLKELQIQLRRCPSVLFQLALDGPRKVEAPHLFAALEANALEWNCELGGPASFGFMSADVPYRVPVPVELAVLYDQSVHQSAQRVSRKVESVAPVVKAVDQQLDPVVCRKIGIAFHLSTDDPLGFGVVAGDSDIEVLIIVEQL